MRTLAPAALLTPILVAASLRVATVWEELPPTMASHFGPGGTPDAFMSREAFFAVFAGLGGGTSLLLVAMPWILRRIPPALVNVPNREYWMAPERREASLAQIGAVTAWFGVAIAAFMAFALELVVQANLSRSPLAQGPMIAGLVAIFAVTIGMLVVVVRRFRLPDER